MKKHLAQIMAVAVALLLLVSSLVACTEKGDGSDTTTAVPAAASSDTPESSSPYVEDDLPELNYNGQKLGVLVWSDVEHFEFNDEIGVEKNVSDLVASKLLSRIGTVQKRLGVEIEFIPVPGNADNLESWNSYIEKALGVDKSFDVIAGYSLSVAKNAASGYLYNLLDKECHYLNFEKPWWSQLLVKEATVNGKLYFASGDISRNALEMMYVCFVNTGLMGEYSLQNPQNLVTSGDWTYDEFISMCKGVYKDLDGSGTKTCTSTTGDQFGYVTSGIHMDPWFYGSGATICDKDADGNLIPADSFSGERVMNTVTKLNSLLWDTDDGIYTSKVYHQRAFGEGRVLFMMDRARVSHKVLKAEYEVDYLVVPCPKYDKDQENYVTVMGNPFTLYAIRKDASDPELASAFIECMASEGYRQITPAVFELQLKTRYVDDPVSSQMYDIIRSNLTYDLGRIFCNPLIGQDTFRNAIKNNNPNWSTYANTAVKLLKNKIPALMEIYK